MRRLLLLLVLLIPLSVPHSAQGAKLVSHLDIPGAVAAGNAFWDAQGVPNPCSRIKADFRVLPEEFLGMALFDENDPCMIALTTRYGFWQLDPLTLCLVITHEIGHARGLDHDPSGRGVMRQVYNFDDAEKNSTPQCDIFSKTHQPEYVTPTRIAYTTKRSDR